MNVLVLNGPNLNLLGTREPALYGTTTLEQIVSALQRRAQELGVAIVPVQANAEGALVEAVHAASRRGDGGAVVNAAAYTHTSIALRDAFLATGLPFVEVHLSNVWRRESFRHQSLLSDIAVGVIGGLGPLGYELALQGLVAHVASVAD